MLLMSHMHTFAQTIKVTESTANFKSGIQPAFSTIIYECKEEDIEKDWKSLMKDYKSEKVSSKDGIFADNIIIPTITDGTLDIYAQIEKIKDNEVKLIVAFDLGGAYLSSTINKPIIYAAATKFIEDFARKTTKNAIGEKLKDAQKMADKLKEQQKELEEKNSDLNKDIENYKSKIKKAEEDLITNKSDQEKKKAEIETQGKIVDEIEIKEKNIK